MLVTKKGIKKIAKENGIKRMSPESVELIQEHVDDIVNMILKSGKNYSEFAKRKTLFKEDIEMAIVMLKLEM